MKKNFELRASLLLDSYEAIRGESNYTSFSRKLLFDAKDKKNAYSISRDICEDIVRRAREFMSKSHLAEFMNSVDPQSTEDIKVSIQEIEKRQLISTDEQYHLIKSEVEFLFSQICASKKSTSQRIGNLNALLVR